MPWPEILTGLGFGLAVTGGPALVFWLGQITYVHLEHAADRRKQWADAPELNNDQRRERRAQLPRWVRWF